MLKAEIDAKTETAKIQATGSLGDVYVECVYLIRAIADEIADTDTRYLFYKDILQSVVTEMKKIENKEGKNAGKSGRMPPACGITSCSATRKA